MVISPASFPSRTYRNSAKDQSSERLPGSYLRMFAREHRQTAATWRCVKDGRDYMDLRLGSGGEIMWVKKSRAARRDDAAEESSPERPELPADTSDGRRRGEVLIRRLDCCATRMRCLGDPLHDDIRVISCKELSRQGDVINCGWNPTSSAPLRPSSGPMIGRD